MNDPWYRVYLFAHVTPLGNELAGRSQAAANVTLRRSPGASVNATLTAHADSGPAAIPPSRSFWRSFWRSSAAASKDSSPPKPPAAENGRQNRDSIESASPTSYSGSTVTFSRVSAESAATATPPCHGSEGARVPYTTSSVCMCAPTTRPSARSNAECVSACGASLHDAFGGPTSTGATSVVARTFSKLNASATSAGDVPSFDARKRKTPTGIDASRYSPGMTGENCVCDSRTRPPGASAEGSYSYHDRG
mmetsp:Transcript_14825/g.58133  ORF Transcript_14825/g.58133 Transcript_14825/m.58133 type:complete len:250 (-) Transcript_14825:467-1216(-)